jgi:ferredoxin
MTQLGAIHLHDILFWIHAAVALALVASIPFTKMRHLIYAPLHVLSRPLRKTGELEKIENIDEAEILGVGKVSEFTSEQLLSFDACLNCGRCEAACPSNNSGMDYSPRKLIQTLRKTMVESMQSQDGKSSQELYAGAFSESYP